MNRRQGDTKSQISDQIKEIEENYKRKIATLEKENKDLDKQQVDLIGKADMMKDMQGDDLIIEEDSLISWMSGVHIDNRSALGMSQIVRLQNCNSDIESLDISNFDE